MKTYFMNLIVFMLLFWSCGEGVINDLDCTENPLENVPWLKELVNRESNIGESNSSGLEIIQYKYLDNTVFSVNNCINNCADAKTIVYDCDQNILCEFGGILGLNTCPDFLTEATGKKVLFTSRNEDITIRFKNSFGSCLGYCNKSIVLNDRLEVYTALSNKGNEETITCTMNLFSSEWDTILSEVDVDVFFLLKEVYGCPDCADGGASSIEIELPSGENKKITFEKGNAPDQIESIASLLQKRLDDTNLCKNENIEQCSKKAIINENVFEKRKASPIKGISIEANCMNITFDLLVTQDPSEDVALIDSGIVGESFPIQRSLKLYIKESLTKPNIVQTTVSFDISGLATWNDPEAILNIEGYPEQVKFIRQPQCGDPNVNCLPTTQEQDFKQLGFMLDELKVISSIVTCETIEDILLATVGSKACGGPQLYLPYTTSISTEEFLNKVDIYTEAEDFYNRKWNVISTCDVVSPPKVVCENGKPILSISTL